MTHRKRTLSSPPNRQSTVLVSVEANQVVLVSADVEQDAR